MTLSKSAALLEDFLQHYLPEGKGFVPNKVIVGEPGVTTHMKFMRELEAAGLIITTKEHRYEGMRPQTYIVLTAQHPPRGKYVTAPYKADDEEIKPPEPRTKPRKCLRCRSPFLPSHKGNFLCRECTQRVRHEGGGFDE